VNTIIKFEAPWCAACKQVDSAMMDLAVERELPVIRVNVEEEAATSKEYRVRQLPTFVLVDENEEEIDRAYNLLGLRQMLDTQRAIDTMK
jgi:thioredoxin-like negative regulator of GroEL